VPVASPATPAVKALPKMLLTLPYSAGPTPFVLLIPAFSTAAAG
jgi:hypothetical protein